MRVTWAGTFDPGFSRNRKLGRLLELAGATVTVVREDLWPSDRIGLATGSWMGTALKALLRYPVLLVRLLLAPPPDVYLVSYPGWFDLPVVWLVARWKRRPVVFDPFISLHDTMISDRRLHSGRSAAARVARVFDRCSLRLADIVLADTPAHLDFYDSLLPGTGRRGVIMPVGADDDVFQPRDASVDESLVLFYGTLVPLQGVATIVEAAALLAETARFRVIGDGQDRSALEEARHRTGASLETIGLVPLPEIADHVARAAVCLGIFGGSEKAGRVVPHKLYECLAMGRPVVTRDGPAIRAMFDETEVVTVPPADPVALADAIRALIRDPERRERVARAGLAAYRDRYHQEVLAGSLELALRSAGGRLAAADDASRLDPAEPDGEVDHTG